MAFYFLVIVYINTKITKVLYIFCMENSILFYFYLKKKKKTKRNKNEALVLVVSIDGTKF